MVEAIVVLVTASSQEEAKMIGASLVEQKLSACANIVSGVHSIFSWKGEICREEETLLVLKTRKSLFEPLCQAVKNIHSYSVPEIIALSVVEGSKEYLEWIEENTLQPPSPSQGQRALRGSHPLF
jgi:periplasmic divalent cation tolerance protein